MSEIEGVSPKKIKQKKIDFNRLLPSGGIEINHGSHGIIYHYDLEDMPKLFTEVIQGYCENDKFYPKMPNILKNCNFGRRFRIVSMVNSRYIGDQTFREWYNNPHGYGIGDFVYTRYIISEYQFSDYMNLIQGDIFQILFKQEKINRIYVYLSDIENNPCIPKYSRDIEDIRQNFTSASQVIKMEDEQNYTILEINVEKYLIYLDEVGPLLAERFKHDKDFYKSWSKDINKYVRVGDKK